MNQVTGVMPKEQAIDFILNSPVKSQPEINIALFIACTALHGKKTWDGLDYDLHYLTVGLSNTHSRTKMVIGILHDVIEDSEWELDDLRLAGFSERVVAGVDGVTKRPGELYFDFVRRCSCNPDSVDIKLQDLKDNMSVSRNPGFPTEWQLKKQRAYVVAYQYLVAIKQHEIAPGTSVGEFMASRPQINDVALLREFSTDRPKPATPAPTGPRL